MGNRARFEIELGKAIRSRVVRALTKSVMLVYETAMMKCPVGKGFPRLRSSIKYTIDEDNLLGLVYVDLKMAPYAPYPEYGTRPHIIEPKNKKALAFNWGGAPAHLPLLDDGRVVLKRVHHPGTIATPYMRPALWENIENIKTIFKQELT